MSRRKGGGGGWQGEEEGAGEGGAGGGGGGEVPHKKIEEQLIIPCKRITYRGGGTGRNQSWIAAQEDSRDKTYFLL